MGQVNKFKSGRTKWRVSLRAKTLFTILLTLISVLLAITFIVDPMINDAFAREEKADTEGKVQQAMAKKYGLSR